jgi:ATPase family protein associated with various cellular activities (AAA)
MRRGVAEIQQARVIGDASVDWFLTLGEAMPTGAISASYLWETEAAPMLSPSAGGSALIDDIVRKSLELRIGESSEVLGGSLPDQALIDPNWPDVVRTFSVWRQVERKVGVRERVWRMDRFLGWHPPTSDPVTIDRGWTGGRKACLVIEDANQRFRSNRAAWEGPLSTGADHIVIRQTGDLGKGELWTELIRQHADCTTLVCAVGDLRKEGAPIGKPLSWERTAQDVVSAIQNRPELAAARRVVVLLATSGAVIFERDGPCLVLFDPFNQEGDWERNLPGIGFGAGSCSLAALVAELTSNPDTPDLGAAARLGLMSAREMFEGGYEASIEADGWRLSFPLDRVASIIAGSGSADNPFQVAEVQRSLEWRLFETAFAGSFRDAAQQIALEGERAAGQEIPIERMGGWSSVDRIEIESMRSVRNIISEYLSTARKGRPLNLAVFGPPGSGKSFAIKQMSKELTTGGARISILEFNLSQLRSADELPAALQRVRDHAVQETLPLVFWDEFDSALAGQELGWLVNFLAPMQDGTFIEAGNTRPIGPAIFVFAGGTHATMDSFRRRAIDLPSTKATDFLSRLRGYVNILGPNPDGPDDRTFPLRRAMLLRAILGGSAPHLYHREHLRIDEGILNAFLDVPKYMHGSRSMESIVEMSALYGALRYERSSLPAVHQIALHVDAEAFMKLVEQGDRLPG